MERFCVVCCSALLMYANLHKRQQIPLTIKNVLLKYPHIYRHSMAAVKKVSMDALQVKFNMKMIKG